MENQPHPNQPLTTLESIGDQVDSSIKIVENFQSVLMFQLLNNAEEIERKIASLDISMEEKRLVVELIERMVKSPFRRQMGKLKALMRCLSHAKDRCDQTENLTRVL